MKRSRTHHLTKYIKVLGKQNLCNNYAVCIACVEKLKNNELLKNTFTNKKLQVKNYLKNYIHFWKKIGNQEELNKIIYLTDNKEKEEMSHKRQRYQNNNNFSENNHEKVLKYLRSMQNSFKVSNFKLTEEAASVKLYSSISTLSTRSHYSKKNSIKGNLIRKINKKETPKFERLQMAFHFNGETKNLNTLRNEKLINDQIGVVLAFDGWKNILNQHIFGSLFITSSGKILIWDASYISNERKRLIEVMTKIKNLIQEINRLNIKLNAIVSDSASAYAAARWHLQLEFPELVFLPCFA
ncbi:hypothetical protein RhiirA4_488626 [Rhizophagus irregularis]|uniref:DUF659 domain-containing protein n=1 Tax=Rhizophagus irregularis TaxID=588596 RepID=A0A2I1HTY4_9GLOM|nr:hypothetical protein RhiirA4_488626 [Rhizophagus irregularis]